MLQFEGSWRFDAPSAAPTDVLDGFFELIGRMATQGTRQRVLEHFKTYFANAAGITCFRSSNESWAETDLHTYMSQASENAPMFIEAFYDACHALRQTGDFAVPDVARINRVLTENAAGYLIEPPNLVPHPPQVTVTVSPLSESLDAQAYELIQRSLKDSEHLLSEGRYRPAVQEILWLLETVSTAFQGLETPVGNVEGTYFNRIVEDLRRNYRGRSLEQVLNWMRTLHGYLSSPTGGGVRHGTSLHAAVTIGPNEARLFCNLIRSYIAFLLAEHERMRID